MTRLYRDTVDRGTATVFQVCDFDTLHGGVLNHPGVFSGLHAFAPSVVVPASSLAKARLQDFAAAADESASPLVNIRVVMAVPHRTVGGNVATCGMIVPLGHSRTHIVSGTLTVLRSRAECTIRVRESPLVLALRQHAAYLQSHAGLQSREGGGHFRTARDEAAYAGVRAVYNSAPQVVHELSSGQHVTTACMTLPILLSTDPTLPRAADSVWLDEATKAVQGVSSRVVVLPAMVLTQQNPDPPYYAKPVPSHVHPQSIIGVSEVRNSQLLPQWLQFHLPLQLVAQGMIGEGSNRPGIQHIVVYGDGGDHELLLKQTREHRIARLVTVVLVSGPMTEFGHRQFQMITNFLQHSGHHYPWMLQFDDDCFFPPHGPPGGKSVEQLLSEAAPDESLRVSSAWLGQCATAASVAEAGHKACMCLRRDGSGNTVQLPPLPEKAPFDYDSSNSVYFRPELWVPFVGVGTGPGEVNADAPCMLNDLAPGLQMDMVSSLRFSTSAGNDGMTPAIMPDGSFDPRRFSFLTFHRTSTVIEAHEMTHFLPMTRGSLRAVQADEYMFRHAKVLPLSWHQSKAAEGGTWLNEQFDDGHMLRTWMQRASLMCRELLPPVAQESWADFHIAGDSGREQTHAL